MKKPTNDDIRILLTNDVAERDTVDGDAPKAAKAMVKKAAAVLAKRAAKSISTS